jgi:hypothetical protein
VTDVFVDFDRICVTSKDNLRDRLAVTLAPRSVTNSNSEYYGAPSSQAVPEFDTTDQAAGWRPRSARADRTRGRIIIVRQLSRAACARTPICLHSHPDLQLTPLPERKGREPAIADLMIK